MKLSCVACQAEFRLDPDRIDVNGSMVRCMKCSYIFMVYPPDYYGSPVVQDTKIEQAILNELLKMQQKRSDRVSGRIFSDEGHFARVDNINSLENKREEELNSDGAEYAELPDLSEMEKMIEWDDIDDLSALDVWPDKSKFNPAETQELDINRI